jgi:hypothetical protein
LLIKCLKIKSESVDPIIRHNIPGWRDHTNGQLFNPLLQIILIVENTELQQIDYLNIVVDVAVENGSMQQLLVAIA